MPRRRKGKQPKKSSRWNRYQSNEIPSVPTYYGVAEVIRIRAPIAILSKIRKFSKREPLMIRKGVLEKAMQPFAQQDSMTGSGRSLNEVLRTMDTFVSHALRNGQRAGCVQAKDLVTARKLVSNPFV